MMLKLTIAVFLYLTDPGGELHGLPGSCANQCLFGTTKAGFNSERTSRDRPWKRLSEFISQQFLEARGNQKNQRNVAGARDAS